MSQEAVASFMAFTGAGPEEAAMFLEMSGGSVELAAELFFSSGMGGGVGVNPGASPGVPSVSDAAPPPDWFDLVWGLSPSQRVPDAWLLQPLEFAGPTAQGAVHDQPYRQVGLVQRKNGPCGVLAVLNAVLIADLLHQGGGDAADATGVADAAAATAPFGPGFKPSPAHLARAIARVMQSPVRGNLPPQSTTADGSEAGAALIRVATWRGAVPTLESPGRSTAGAHANDVAFTEVHPDALLAYVQANIEHYTAPGGLLLVVYSCVQSHPAGGAAGVRAEVHRSGGQGPLITGPFTLCTSELLSLMLRGSGDGNVGAYGPLGGDKVDWPQTTCPVGLLSMAEVEHSVPVCDRLKSPAGGPGRRVWILHGRDHFTLCFEAPGVAGADGVAGMPSSSLYSSSSAAAAVASAAVAAASTLQQPDASPVPTGGAAKRVKPAEEPLCPAASGKRGGPATAGRSAVSGGGGGGGGGSDDADVRRTKQRRQQQQQPPRFSVFHWNGLPPAGPRMTEVVVTPRLSERTGAPEEASPAPATSKEGISAFRTPRVGQVWDVVQANQDDKKARPKKWRSWRYEVVLAVPDPAGRLYGKGESWPEGEGPPTFEQGDAGGGGGGDGRWRCATCYVKRHETMAFKLNDADAPTCMHCGRPRAECGWSLWMTYGELPTRWKRTCDRRHQPPIITLLKTKWPGAEVAFAEIGADGKPVADVEPPAV